MEKVGDVDQYLKSTGEDPKTILSHWSRTETWNSFQPAGALSAEKSLFISDMRVAIRILTLRFGAAAQGHSA